MTDFNSMLQADALNMIQALGGEQAVYTPSGGAARTIWVIVDRNPPERYTANGQVLVTTLGIKAANDNVQGISSANMDANGADTVTVAPRLGGPTVTYGVYLPPPGSGIRHDPGMVYLDLR